MTSTQHTYQFTSRKINPDALNQDTDWYDAKGTHYLIKDMSRMHAINALRKLMVQFGAKAFNTPLYNALSEQGTNGN